MATSTDKIKVGSRVKFGQFIGTVAKIQNIKVKGGHAPGAILTITNKINKQGNEMPLKNIPQSLTIPLQNLTPLEPQPVQATATAQTPETAKAGSEPEPEPQPTSEPEPQPQPTSEPEPELVPGAAIAETPTSPATSTKFNVGDTVEITGGTAHDGKQGKVVWVMGGRLGVEVDGERLHLARERLRKVDLKVKPVQATASMRTVTHPKPEPEQASSTAKSATGTRVTRDLRLPYLSPTLPVARTFVASVELGECETDYFRGKDKVNLQLVYDNEKPALKFDHRGHVEAHAKVVIPLINDDDCQWTVHISKDHGYIKFVSSEGCSAKTLLGYGRTINFQVLNHTYHQDTEMSEQPQVLKDLLGFLCVFSGRGRTVKEMGQMLDTLRSRKEEGKKAAGFRFSDYSDPSVLHESTALLTRDSTLSGSTGPSLLVSSPPPNFDDIERSLQSEKRPTPELSPEPMPAEESGFFGSKFNRSDEKPPVVENPRSVGESQESLSQEKLDILETHPHLTPATVKELEDHSPAEYQTLAAAAAAAKAAKAAAAAKKKTGGGKKSKRRKSNRRKYNRRKSTRRKSKRRKSRTRRR